MFLYTLEHLIPDGYDEIPTFALYHPLLLTLHSDKFGGTGQPSQEH